MTALALYRAATDLGWPLIRLYLARRLAAGKEDAARFAERLGTPGRARPDGRLVWAHAASVGEALSLLPLIERLRADDPARAVLVTTGTVTSAAMMAERLPDGAFHQYVPVDRAAGVRRFLDHWRPDGVLWAESELWPNLIREAAARGAPLVLVNGRMSPRSFARWRRYPRAIADLLGAFDLCLAQTDADGGRFRALGAGRVECPGNLKFAAPPLPVDDEAFARLQRAVGDRPRWLAASTHAGEEEICGRIHAGVRGRHADLLTIVVPRHATRGAEIAAALAADGLRVARRAAGELPDAATDVYVADTMGELGLFYRLAPIAFIGKSLAAAGGQNPLEAAQLGCAVLFGPRTENFAEMCDRLVAAGGALRVGDEAALADAVARLLEGDAELPNLGNAGRAFAAAEAGVLDRVMAAIDPYLPAAAGDARARA